MTSIFSLFLLLYALGQPMISEAGFITGKVDKAISVYVFDGFKTKSVGSDCELIKEKIPVTEGNFFVLFFIKHGYLPVTKIFMTGKEDIDFGVTSFSENMDEEKGFLAGVVFKPVQGGKIFFQKGISRLLEGITIKIVDNKGVMQLVKSGNTGTFGISLKTGKYKVKADDDKEGTEVLIENAKTTIHNLQMGVILID